MQRRVESELAEADAALFVVNGDQGVGGAGDRFIAEALASARVPIAIAVNKVDRLNHTRTVQALPIASELGLPEAEVFPISARTGQGVPPLLDFLAGLLPEGPFYFPPEDFSDQPEDVMLAELVREQVLQPHAPGGPARRRGPDRGDRAARERDRRPRDHVGRDRVPEGHPDRRPRPHDQGHRHRRPQGDRARARPSHVHLDLSVRVRRSWRADDALLDRLGIT